MTRYWKFTRPGRTSLFVRYAWPEPGVWVSAAVAQPCRQGIHACRVADLPYWVADELWEVELGGPILAEPYKVVGTRARLVGRITAWDAAAQEEFALACVGRTLQYAVRELRTVGLDAAADRLASGSSGGRLAPGLAETASALADDVAEAGHRSAAWQCGYLADAVASVGVEPVAAMAYIAARAAGHADGADEEERAWQAGWLARRLSLPSPDR